MNFITGYVQNAGQYQILLVEDEQNLSETIALNLRMEGYQVSIARNGAEARNYFNGMRNRFSLVLMDVMLPDANGFELCRELRQLDPAVPVIFLTAKNQVVDKLEGLRLGADDYITKPFDLEELLLRVANLIRRSGRKGPSLYAFNGCEVNFGTYEIRDIRGERFTLSKREIGLLELLTANSNKVISRDEIIEKLWAPDENASTRTIDNYILNFRKYFEKNPREPQHFHSVRGVGYKFTD
jgi:two-component system, OmpR family, alkaline phosphatase synthesis response regulator PhoP